MTSCTIEIRKGRSVMVHTALVVYVWVHTVLVVYIWVHTVLAVYV